MRDVAALLAGALLFSLTFVIACTVVVSLSTAQCKGEWRPFLGSGHQAFAVYGCLLRDAGPLINVKKALGIYNPAWQPVIK